MLHLKTGDSVVVKQNVQDPDFDICIGGWQGRISDIETQKNLICIEWDSYTLKQMPSELIEQSEYDGLDWQRMFLKTHEVEPSQPRDTEDNVKSTIAYLHKKYFWLRFGEAGKRIAEVLNRKNSDDELTAYEAWEEYLFETLTFPFKAKIAEPQEKGPLESGEQVKVTEVEASDDLYGIIMQVYLGRRKYDFPLCELDAIEQLSTNHQPVEDYKIWFANH